MAIELSKQNKGTQEWVPLEYHDAGSINSLRYLQKMIQKETSPIQFSMSSRDYLDSLCSIKPTKNLKSDGLSKRSLLSLPLEERFKYYLVQGASIHRFDALTHLLNPDESIEETLKVLQENAQLVQGLWVPKSSLLQFETNQEINELARDYILVQFNKSLLINNTQIPNSPLILVNAMKNVLNTLAIKRITLENWKFKEDQDTTFIKLYPNIVKKQEENCKLLEKHIHEYFTKKKITGFMSSTSTSTSTSSNSSSKTFKSVMSEETKEGLSKAIVKILHSNKVCSFQEIRKYMREIAIYASGHPKGNAKVIEVGNICDEESEEFLIILNEVAMNVHGFYVLRSSLDYPQYDDLRKIVIELLIGEGPNAKIKKASIYEAAKLKLKREISNIEYQKVLQEICVSKGSSWVLKNVDENSV